MLEENKSKSTKYIWIGLILHLVAVLANILLDIQGIGMLISLVGAYYFIYGCAMYMKGKGYSGWWGALGIFSLLGLLVLAMFPNRHKQV